MKTEQPSSSSFSDNGSDQLKVPSSSNMEHILIIYPSLFMLSLLIYFVLRTKFPSYFILRIHFLNYKYVLTPSRNYLFYNEPLKKHPAVQNEIFSSEESNANTPLLQKNVVEAEEEQVSVDSIRFNPFRFNLKFNLRRNKNDSQLNYNTIDTESGSEASERNIIGPNLEMVENEDEVKRQFDEYKDRNIFIRFKISIVNGFKSLFVVLQASDMDLMDLCGLDQLVILRTIRLMMQLLLGYMIPSLLFLLPLYQLQPQDTVCIKFCQSFKVNSTDGNQDAYKAKCICTFIDQSSLAMVKCAHADSENIWNFDINCLPLWGPVFAMYWVTLFTLWLLRREYKKIIYFRNNVYWLKKKPPQLYTVLLDEIPSQIKLSTKQAIFEHFEKLFPGKVHAVEVVATSGRSSRILAKLRETGEKRETVLMQLQHVLASVQRDDGRRMVKKFVGWCKREEAVGYYLKRLEALNVDFEKFHRRYMKASERFSAKEGDPVVSSVFITFNSVVACTIAEQALLHEQKNIVVIRAPEPSNVHFDLLGYSEGNLTIRRYFSKVIFFLIILFWGTLTAAVTGLTNPQSLKKELPFLVDELNKYEAVIDLIAPLTLIILLSLVNPLIRFVSSLHVRVSESEIDELNTFYYFFFLVMQLFLFYGIAGTVFILFQHIIDSPRTLLITLALTIPKNAAFYISFVVTKLFTMLGLDLLRIFSAFTHLLRWFWFGSDLTNEDVHKVSLGLPSMKLPTHNYLSSTKAELLLIYFIATTYITIQPLIAPTAFIFFVLAYIIYGNNFLNVSIQRYDNGGTSWPHLYICFISALLTSQLTLIGVLTIKEGLEQVVALWILVVFTIGVSHVIDGRYRKLLQNIPLNIAQKIDQENRKATVKIEPSAIFQYQKLFGTPGYLKTEPRREVTIYDYQLPVLRERVFIDAPVLDT